MLDRERLHALIQFLEGALSQNTSASPPQTGLLVHSQVSEPNYSSAIDLRERISAVPAFDNWRKTSKQGFEQKLQRLISEIRNFVNTPSPGLFPKNASHSEFEVLRAIIQSLLSDAEAALQY
ncbi:MAG: hypothetical protein ABI614_08065 [Planctomycetota bacterium]